MTTSREVKVYIRAIEDELLDLTWRQRRAILADATQHLEESEPEELGDARAYAVELRSALDLGPRQLRRLGTSLLSIWPTPLAWVLAGLTGVVIVFGGTAVVRAIERIPWSDAGFQTTLADQLRATFPVPRVSGSRFFGLALLAASWGLAQIAFTAMCRTTQHHWRRLVLVAGLIVGVFSALALWALQA